MKVQKKSHHGKYARTIDAFLKTGSNACKVDCTESSVQAVYMGLNRAIKSKYSDKVFLSRVDGEVYIEKL